MERHGMILSESLLTTIIQCLGRTQIARLLEHMFDHMPPHLHSLDKIPDISGTEQHSELASLVPMSMLMPMSMRNVAVVRKSFLGFEGIVIDRGRKLVLSLFEILLEKFEGPILRNDGFFKFPSWNVFLFSSRIVGLVFADIFRKRDATLCIEFHFEILVLVSMTKSPELDRLFRFLVLSAGKLSLVVHCESDNSGVLGKFFRCRDIPDSMKF